MDAGAGTGVLQWYLAEQGAEVLSVDRGSRSDLPLRFRRRFHVQGLRPQDLAPASQAMRLRLGTGPWRDIQHLGRDLLRLPGAARRQRPRDGYL